MSPITSVRRVFFLRRAVVYLYSAAGGTDPRGSDMDQFVSDPRACRQARIAVALNSEGRLGNGEGE